MNHPKDRNARQVKEGCYTWAKKARNQFFMVPYTWKRKDRRFPVYRWLLRHPQLSAVRNMVSPTDSSSWGGRTLARVYDGPGGKGRSRKRMPACNGQDRDICPDLKGCRLTPGASRQRREVYLGKYVIQRRRPARSMPTRYC